MNVTSHQKKEKNEETKTIKRRAGKKEDRRPILKKPWAALLQSFRGQHGKQMKRRGRGNWDPWESQQPF